MTGVLDTIDLLLATSPTAPGGEIAMRQAELRKARATIVRVEKALFELLERGTFDSDGDFCVYATEAEREAQDADSDDLGIAEVKEAYAALREFQTGGHGT